MTLLSRVFGFIRDMVIAMTFGSSAAADAFFVAFRIPNMQRRLLGEGAVTAVFIPVFSEYLNTKSEEEAWTLTSNLLNIFFIALTVITLAIMIFAPYVIMAFAPGFMDEPDKFELTVGLTRWMAPFLICIGLAALCMGILNTFKVFALPALAPILLNISMIVSALVLSPYMDEPIYGLAVGVVIGGILQLVFQLPATIRKGLKIRFALDWKHPGIIKIGKLIVPVILGLAMYEVNLLVDTILASLLPGGSISYLYYGNRLVQLPLGVFGVALGVALLPMLSEQAARREFSELVQTLSFGIRLILFITVPATVGLILLRFPIINTLWERGEFLRSSTEGTAIALLYYSVGLCAFAGIKVIVPAFYSLQDTKTPFRIAIYAMVLNIILNLILMGPLQHGGLALATSIAALFNVALLIFHLKKKLGRLGGRKILVSVMKLGMASSVMGIIIYFLNNQFFDPLDSSGYKLLILTGCIFAGVISFGLISYLMKNEELFFLMKMKGEGKPSVPKN